MAQLTLQQKREGIDVALEAAEKAMTISGIKVGGALHSRFGWTGGFNVEEGDGRAIHGEKTAILLDMARGLRLDDWDYYIEAYQDPKEDNPEIYPMCPACWTVYRAYATPGITIGVADVKERER